MNLGLTVQLGFDEGPGLNKNKLGMKLGSGRYCLFAARFAVGVVWCGVMWCGVVWNMTDLRGPWEELVSIEQEGEG